jgi:murein DD-endopeptidase MepM/ murein hydrolase activator NlpD
MIRIVAATLFLIGGLVVPVSAQNGRADEVPVASFGFVPWDAPDAHHLDHQGLLDNILLHERPVWSFGAAADDAVTFSLPIRGTLDVDYIMHNYVDHDAGASVQDFMGGRHAYSGHRGTDFSIRSFREMDRGVPIYAAAPGVIDETRYGFPDRNSAWADGIAARWNGAVIRHDETTGSAYLHFRTNSLTVEPGETVERGQLLGFMGSSGFSSNPHLHFEMLEHNGSAWVHRDPWEGPVNPRPSMWHGQLPYVGDDPLKVYDIGVATRESMGGNVNQFDWHMFVERLSEPAVFGRTDQSNMIIWFLAQNGAGQQYRIRILRPGGAQWSQAQTTMTNKHMFGIWYWTWSASPAMDLGEWTIQMLEGDGAGNYDRVVFERTFMVGNETEWAPRFLPAGKSIRINGDVQRDTLRMSPFTGEVTYTILGQPDHVAIEQDSIVVFGGTSSQARRSDFFQVVATDQHSRTDTMWYHVVDPSKPLDALATSSEAVAGELPRALQIEQNYPNPFNPSTSIAFSVASPGRVALRIFDALGRRVATPLSADLPAGRHTVTWTPSGLPSGVYFYRIESGGAAATGKMLLLK